MSDRLSKRDKRLAKVAKKYDRSKNDTFANQYVSDALAILNSNEDIREFGSLLNETWKMKKGLADNVTDERIDAMYRMGLENGAVGGKLLGAGGGGFMLFFVPREKRKELKKAMTDYVCVPFQFENSGSQVIYYKQEDERG